MAVAGDGTVYVSDTGLSRIQFSDPAGDVFGKWGNSGNGNGQFSLPAGVALAPDSKTIDVADAANNRIQAFCVTPP